MPIVEVNWFSIVEKEWMSEKSSLFMRSWLGCIAVCNVLGLYRLLPNIYVKRISDPTARKSIASKNGKKKEGRNIRFVVVETPFTVISVGKVDWESAKTICWIKAGHAMPPKDRGFGIATPVMRIIIHGYPSRLAWVREYACQYEGSYSRHGGRKWYRLYRP